MELRYPFVIILGIIFIIVLIFVFKKKGIKYSNGVKVANTSYIKSNEYYKKKINEYKVIIYILKGICLFTIFVSVILLSRVSKTEKVNANEYNRDIFLCMDASGSVDELNLSLVDNLRDTVKSLKGERFGISIFNTSSVILVPLTEDYDYVLDTLDSLKDSFDSLVNPNYFDNESYTKQNYITSGTLVGAEERGSSLIGDGLASCVYSFPKLEEDRTRIIIFSTDNELAGTPLLTLEEAANISKSKNITIFGIGTKLMNDKNRIEFKNAVAKTGGDYFEQSNNSVNNIVKSIERQSKSLLKKESQSYKTDLPTIPFIMLLVSFIVLIILEKKVI